ncbi:hypothetical protein LTR74_018659, partial [Friedmanniomyces endolithicus]
LCKCKDGNRCTYAHVIDPNFNRKACVHFANDKCNPGEKCMFSHVPEDIALLKATMSSADSGGRELVNTEALFKEWRYTIPLPDRIATARPLGPARTKFCKDALELVSGGAGQVQEVFALLASEGGCMRVKEIAGQRFDQLTAAQTVRIFDAQALPSFKIVTYKNVAYSYVLAPRVMTIYNIVYGENGHGGARLFRAVVTHLQTLELTKADDSNAADWTTADAIDTSHAVLDNLVEVNTEAQIHDELKLVVEALRIFLENHLPATANCAFKSALKHLRRLEQRLGLGQALPDAKDNVETINGRAVFDLVRERPGELSEDGPRHNNDHVDIRQIFILPTL